MIYIYKAPFNIGKTGKPMIIDKKITDLPIKEISKNNFGKDVCVCVFVCVFSGIIQDIGKLKNFKYMRF